MVDDWPDSILDWDAFGRLAQVSGLPLRASSADQKLVHLALNKLARIAIIRSFYRPVPLRMLDGLVIWESGNSQAALQNRDELLDEIESNGLGWAQLPSPLIAEGQPFNNRLRLDVRAARDAGKGHPKAKARRARLQCLLKCFWTLHVPQAAQTAMTSPSKHCAARFVCAFYREVRHAVVRLDIRDHHGRSRKARIEVPLPQAVVGQISRIAASKPWATLTIWECGEIMDAGMRGDPLDSRSPDD